MRVVAPQARPEIRQLAAEGKLEWIEREFRPSDLDGNFIVIAATDVPEINAAVYREAVARGIPCNSVDDIPNCDFFFGSVVSRGDLQIAISTSGESPAVAQRLRREIDEQLPQDLGPWLAELGELRREVLANIPVAKSAVCSCASLRSPKFAILRSAPRANWRGGREPARAQRAMWHSLALVPAIQNCSP